MATSAEQLRCRLIAEGILVPAELARLELGPLEIVRRHRVLGVDTVGRRSAAADLRDWRAGRPLKHESAG